MIKLNPEPHVRTAQADLVAVSEIVDDEAIVGLDVDLTRHDPARHTSVSLPAVASAGVEAARSIRFRVSYVGAGAEERVPLRLFVTAFREGEAVAETSLRFFAGSDEAPIALPLTFGEHGDGVQLTFYADRTLGGTLAVRDLRLLAGETELRFTAEGLIAGAVDRRKEWRQEGSRAICRSYFGEHWAEMPEGWSLARVHPAALAVAEWLIYDRVEQACFGVAASDLLVPEPRRFGSETLLSYSLGTDSTAALTLLPDTVAKYYCRRPYARYVTPSGAYADVAPQTIYEPGLGRVPGLTIVPTTFEMVGLAAGVRHGFGHPFGYGAIGLLLADHVDAGALAFGSVMEQVFLRSGNIYSDVVAMPGSAYNKLRRLLECAGLRFALPTGGCSEVLTTRISNEGRFSGLAISCPFPAADGTACGHCFKCFRKLRLEGRQDVPPPDENVLHVLDKYPLKSATSVVYAAQRSGFSHPAVDRYREVDLAFLERYYPYAVEHMLPVALATHVRAELSRLGIEPMTPDDEVRLRSVGEVFWPEQERARNAKGAARLSPPQF